MIRATGSCSLLHPVTMTTARMGYIHCGRIQHSLKANPRKQGDGGGRDKWKNGKEGESMKENKVKYLDVQHLLRFSFAYKVPVTQKWTSSSSLPIKFDATQRQIPEINASPTVRTPTVCGNTKTTVACKQTCRQTRLESLKPLMHCIISLNMFLH